MGSCGTWGDKAMKPRFKIGQQELLSYCCQYSMRISSLSKYINICNKCNRFCRIFGSSNNERKCSICQVIKPISQFFKNKCEESGYSYECKLCKNKKCKKDRMENPEKYRLKDHKAYESNRDKIIKRKKEYSKTKHAKELACKRSHMQRIIHPFEYNSRQIAKRAIKTGILIRKPCEVCGSTEKIHAHHSDYSKPLEVHWLCVLHHKHVHMGRIFI